MDEDGAAEDAVVINFAYSFESGALGVEGPGDGVVPSEDDLRIDLIATFNSGGRRGGTSSVDVDCDGSNEEYVRSVQQRHRFDPPACTPVCDTVSLTDSGASSDDPSCVEVLNDHTLDADIVATAPGNVNSYSITGTASCVNEESCSSNVTNLAVLDGEGCEGGLIEGSPAGATFTVDCSEGASPDEIEPGDFRTQTQGGWGSSCNGNNPGCYRDAHFASCFGGGLLIGDPDGIDGDGVYAALFTSSAAVEAFLPAGGPPGPLTADLTDPVTSSAGILLGQVTALSLSVGFDLCDPDFGASDTHLADLVMSDGGVCDGLTVRGSWTRPISS